MPIPAKNFYIGGGAFDASFVDDQFIRDDSFDDVWTAGETGITWDALGPVRNGRVAFGGWWDSREMARFDGNGNETTYGLYAVAEQRLWGPSDDKDDDHGFSIFGQWNYSNPEVNPAQIQYGLGLALHGMAAARRSATPSPRDRSAASPAPRRSAPRRRESSASCG